MTSFPMIRFDLTEEGFPVVQTHRLWPKPALYNLSSNQESRYSLSPSIPIHLYGLSLTCAYLSVMKLRAKENFLVSFLINSD